MVAVCSGVAVSICDRQMESRVVPAAASNLGQCNRANDSHSRAANSSRLTFARTRDTFTLRPARLLRGGGGDRDKNCTALQEAEVIESISRANLPASCFLPRSLYRARLTMLFRSRGFVRGNANASRSCFARKTCERGGKNAPYSPSNREVAV